MFIKHSFISTFNHAISQQQILLSRRSTDAGICCSVHEVTLQKYRSSQQSIITSLIVVIGAIALKIMALLNQNMNHAIAFCTGNMSHTTHNTIINFIWNIADDAKGCLCTR
ncbi:hypothetical protein [Nostoc punctiforme]|uniref:hypothetical protein n=1 Tax=Nostoc punctiforme TaxID=272131 RepID=UPI001F1747CF|nr:hypothetical protein [Nostoc punctiforme]